jgi:cytochrome b6-f complex iron-sulfur subunit
MKGPADRYVSRLLSGRRPRAFPASAQDAARIRTAIELTAYRSELAGPSDDFVARLHAELADRQGVPAGQRRSLASWLHHRRQFLRGGLVTAAVFGTGFVTERLLPQSSTPAPPQTEVRAAPGAWHTVTSSAQLAEGAVLDFDLGSLNGFIHRTSGRLRAVSGICTHQACRLALDQARTALVCPCHEAVFTLAGTPRPPTGRYAPDALPPLPRLPVREHQGHIQVYGPATPSAAPAPERPSGATASPPRTTP